MSSNPFREFIDRYGPAAGAEGPVLMVKEVFGAQPDPWQADVLRAYGRGDRRISIRACHGPGKTALAAWMIWHMLLTRFPQATVATAPSAPQLDDGLVKEVKLWGERLPANLKELFEPKKNRIELRASPSESFFSARTARAEKPEALQGVHADNVLLIADEASGVPEAIFKAGQGSMSGKNATTLLLSNPTRNSGFFWASHKRSGVMELWTRFHISWEDSSRVGEEFEREQAAYWGRDSNEYRVRVLGEFPLTDLNTIFPARFIEAAQNRDVVIPFGEHFPEVWGLDVARFGDDRNALCRRNRLMVPVPVETWKGVDLMGTVNRVHALWRDTPLYERPEEVIVDAIGLGGGVADRLAELGLPVVHLNVSETAPTDDKYQRLGTELAFRAREWLMVPEHSLPREDEVLASELALIQYGYTDSGKLVRESKKKLKARGYPSPDTADSFLLTFASEPAAMTHGGRGGWEGRGWNQPLHRERSIV